MNDSNEESGNVLDEHCTDSMAVSQQHIALQEKRRNTATIEMATSMSCFKPSACVDSRMKNRGNFLPKKRLFS